MISQYAKGMASWFRRTTSRPAASRPALDDSSAGGKLLVAPLVLGELLIEAVEVPHRRATRASTYVVQWSVGQTQTRLHPQEIRDLLAGRVSIIDSLTGGDDAFLCDAAGVATAAAAGKPSDAGKWTAVFPPDALALLVGGIEDQPAVVVRGAEKELLARWLETVPSS